MFYTLFVAVVVAISFGMLSVAAAVIKGRGHGHALHVHGGMGQCLGRSARLEGPCPHAVTGVHRGWREVTPSPESIHFGAMFSHATLTRGWTHYLAYIQDAAVNVTELVNVLPLKRHLPPPPLPSRPRAVHATA